MTKERGLTLFEIHQGLLRTLKKDLEQPLSTTEATSLQERLEDVINLGLSAQKCLQYERNDSFEGKDRES